MLPSVEVGPFRTSQQFFSEICTKMDELETRMHYPKSKREGKEYRRKTVLDGHHFDNIEILSSLWCCHPLEVGPFRAIKHISELCTKWDELETWMHYPKSK